MKTSLSRPDLLAYARHQLDAFFPDGQGGADLGPFLDTALERLEHCFSRIHLTAYQDPDGPIFNHWYTDHYAAFLYLLCHSAHRASPGHPVARKAYALNRALHGLDVYYGVDLPEIFLFSHPVATVLGRGVYGDYFCCYQSCTVGVNANGERPVLGRGVVLYTGSGVYGRTVLEDNTRVAEGASVHDFRGTPNSVLHGRHPGTAVKESTRSVVEDVFGTAERLRALYAEGRQWRG